MLHSGKNSISVLVSNDDGEALFDKALQIDLIELQPPSDLDYTDNQITLLYDEDYTSRVPNISGQPPSFLVSLMIF